MENPAKKIERVFQPECTLFFVLKTIEWRSIRVCLMHGVRWLDWMNLISHCLCGHSEENLGSAKRGMSFLRCCKPSLHRWFY